MHVTSLFRPLLLTTSGYNTLHFTMAILQVLSGVTNTGMPTPQNRA